MIVKPTTIRAACRYVAEHHRHLPAPRGGLFAASVVDDAGVVRGVAVVGRPSARMLADGWTCEVVRVATDGAPNACSMLYAACIRAARALGYRAVITYTLASEPGTSLRAAGMVDASRTRGGQWGRAARPREERQGEIAGVKVRWAWRREVAGD